MLNKQKGNKGQQRAKLKSVRSKKGTTTMSKIKIFTSPTCPNCPPAKLLGQQLKDKEDKNIVVEMFDVTEAGGLAEGAMFNVLAIPVIIVTDEDDKEIKAWRGELPTLEDILKEV